MFETESFPLKLKNYFLRMKIIEEKSKDEQSTSTSLEGEIVQIGNIYDYITDDEVIYQKKQIVIHLLKQAPAMD